MITQEILQLITQVGIGNSLLILGILLIIANLPTIIEKVVGLFSKRTEGQKVETYVKHIEKENEERLAEHAYLKESLDHMADSVDSISKMMRNVMSERDSLGLISLKMGFTDDFKTRLIDKISEIVASEQNNGQIETDIKTVIKSEWLDLKSELEAFSFPFNIRSLLDKYDEELWNEGMFAVIKDIAIKDLDLDRKCEAISKQIDLGLRYLTARLTKNLEETQARKT